MMTPSLEILSMARVKTLMETLTIKGNAWRAVAEGGIRNNRYLPIDFKDQEKIEKKEIKLIEQRWKEASNVFVKQPDHTSEQQSVAIDQDTSFIPLNNSAEPSTTRFFKSTREPTTPQPAKPINKNEENLHKKSQQTMNINVTVIKPQSFTFNKEGLGEKKPEKAQSVQKRLALGLLTNSLNPDSPSKSPRAQSPSKNSNKTASPQPPLLQLPLQQQREELAEPGSPTVKFKRRGRRGKKIDERKGRTGTSVSPERSPRGEIELEEPAESLQVPIEVPSPQPLATPSAEQNTTSRTSVEPRSTMPFPKATPDEIDEGDLLELDLVLTFDEDLATQRTENRFFVPIGNINTGLRNIANKLSCLLIFFIGVMYLTQVSIQTIYARQYSHRVGLQPERHDLHTIWSLYLITPATTIIFELFAFYKIGGKRTKAWLILCCLGIVLSGICSSGLPGGISVRYESEAVESLFWLIVSRVFLGLCCPLLPLMMYMYRELPQRLHVKLMQMYNIFCNMTLILPLGIAWVVEEYTRVNTVRYESIVGIACSILASLSIILLIAKFKNPRIIAQDLVHSHQETTKDTEDQLETRPSRVSRSAAIRPQLTLLATAERLTLLEQYKSNRLNLFYSVRLSFSIFQSILSSTLQEYSIIMIISNCALTWPTNPLSLYTLTLSATCILTLFYLNTQLAQNHRLSLLLLSSSIGIINLLCLLSSLVELSGKSKIGTNVGSVVVFACGVVGGGILNVLSDGFCVRLQGLGERYQSKLPCVPICRQLGKGIAFTLAAIFVNTITQPALRLSVDSSLYLVSSILSIILTVNMWKLLRIDSSAE